MIPRTPISKKLLGAALGACLAGLALPALAANIEEIHFLVPGGAGGGWDGTARGTGEALTKAGLIDNATYENMSGGGGGKAIAHLIETADQQQNTLMVNSTPIVIRALLGVFPQSFRDLTMVAGTIGDYAALVTHTDSDITTFQQLNEAMQADPARVAIGGGSVAGGMDHLVAALVMGSAGNDPTTLKYIPYDAGGKAMAGLLSGEIQALSTGFSEAIALAEQGEVNILCVTAAEPVPAYPDYPTCKDAGAGDEAEFVNWRGFFGPPGLPQEKVDAYIALFEQMYDTEAWETVRARNGWVEIYHPGSEFVAFLERQEKQIGDLMRELGFL